jgi:hypothetical protein
MTKNAAATVQQHIQPLQAVAGEHEMVEARSIVLAERHITKQYSAGQRGRGACQLD